MVIKQEVLEKIIEILQGWSDRQMTSEQMQAKGIEVRESLGIGSNIQDLTTEELDLISEAVTQAISIYDERKSNAN
jgi:hypothetical protein|nr:MAG TPA: hypothetical protein [Caudoviricetes sp.]